MGVFAISAFVAILFSSSYITNINACPSSRMMNRTNYIGMCDPDPVEYVESEESLGYYSADHFYHKCLVCHWHEMVSTPIDERISMKLLEQEANNTSEKPRSRMFEYLQRANDHYRCVTGLTRAECLVVIMYTDNSESYGGDYDDSDDFYKEFTLASKSRRWRPYRVYTTLLVSALQKLAMIDPIPQNTTLYRGITFRPKEPFGDPSFLNAFSLTSLNIKVAKRLAGPRGTILEFQPPGTQLVGRIRSIANNPFFDEVLLLPFEAFDFRSKTTFTSKAELPIFSFRPSQTSLKCNWKKIDDGLLI